MHICRGLQAQQLRHIKDSFHTVRTKVAGEDDTGPFPLFDTPWLVGKALLYGLFKREERKCVQK